MDRPPPRASATLPQKLTSRFAEEDPAHRAILCEADSDDGNVLRVGGAVVKMKLLGTLGGPKLRLSPRLTGVILTVAVLQAEEGSRARKGVRDRSAGDPSPG